MRFSTRFGTVEFDNGNLSGDEELISSVKQVIASGRLCGCNFWQSIKPSLDTEWEAYLTICGALGHVTGREPEVSDVPDNPDGYEPEGIWPQDGFTPRNSAVGSLVAACLAEACAPPPVGTGGSQPSGGRSSSRSSGRPTVVTARSFDEIKEKFGVDGTGTSHVYRSVSEADYQRMKRQGYLDTDGRGNVLASEGMVTAKHLPWVYLGDIARKGASDNPTGTGRILKIRREEADGWLEDSRDGYVKTSKPVPFDRVEMVTMPIGVRREIKYFGEPGDESNSTTKTIYDWSAADKGPLTASVIGSRSLASATSTVFACMLRACAPPR